MEWFDDFQGYYWPKFKNRSGWIQVRDFWIDLVKKAKIFWGDRDMWWGSVGPPLHSRVKHGEKAGRAKAHSKGRNSSLLERFNLTSGGFSPYFLFTINEQWTRIAITASCYSRQTWTTETKEEVCALEILISVTMPGLTPRFRSGIN